MFVGIVLYSGTAVSETGEVSGKVLKLRQYQYLSNVGWDKESWFCLDSNANIGTCATSSSSPCSGKPLFVISKDASSAIFSTVLAARMSEKPLTVTVDDSFKYGPFCYARIIDI